MLKTVTKHYRYCCMSAQTQAPIQQTASKHCDESSKPLRRKRIPKQTRMLKSFKVMESLDDLDLTLTDDENRQTDSNKDASTKCKFCDTIQTWRIQAYLDWVWGTMQNRGTPDLHSLRNTCISLSVCCDVIK